MKAAMYLRVSTEEQREKQSIETQRTFARSYCASNNISPYGWYEDDGISGMIPLEQRKDGYRLLADARAGIIDAIFVYKLDRLGREPRLILNAVNDFESLGVQIISMTEPFETSNPSGRFLLTILSAVAGLERDTIIQRSMEGSNRLAREGAWLGGIVPFGYRVLGKDRNSRLIVSEEDIPGLAVSEADIIRLIFHLTAEERKSCQAIADYLNAMSIPPVYVRDGREPLRGKHKSATAGIWRAGRIRGIITNPTYKGIHLYGQRSKKKREVIERVVPAIVSVETWERAQTALHEHMLFSRRNAKRNYLLRGIIKCALCGLTCIGTVYPSCKRQPKVYYVCNGKHQPGRIYGSKEKRCPSKAVDGAKLENAIWHDIEQFLHHPGQVLELVTEQLAQRGDETGKLRHELARLQQNLQAKNREKDAVITLFRKGRIDERSLNSQLDQIEQEERDLQKEIEQLQGLMQDAQNIETTLRSTEETLKRLRQHLEEPITWELKRQLIEDLIERIVIDTVENEHGKKESKIMVIYRFGASVEV
ncbi:MAG TPA: recombinase family protein [Ktedonobacteraceae bacterium]|nr:recombinase family protein [Ktedonobacteraceae bacterium]